MKNTLTKNWIAYRTAVAVLLISVLNGIAACSSNTGADETVEKVTEEQAIDALIQIILDSDIAFPASKEVSKIKEAIDLFGSDYISADSSPNGLLQLQLWIGPDGHIIPKPEWQQNHPNICSEQGRFMRGAVRLLEFEIHPTSKEVQANIIDIETGIIKESVMGKTSLPDSDWLDHSLNDAWKKINEKVSIQDAVGPCEGRRQLDLAFQSEIRTTITDGSGNTEIHDDLIEAHFELDFDEDENFYDGWGIVEREYSYPLPTGEGSCTTPNNSLSIEKLITPWIDDVSDGEPEMTMRWLSDGYLTLECGIADEDKYIFLLSWNHLYDLDWFYDSFTISDWELVPDHSSIVMRKVIEREVTVGDTGAGTVTSKEVTTIEIIDRE